MKKIVMPLIILILVVLVLAQQNPSSTSQDLPQLKSFAFEDVLQFSIKQNGKFTVQAKLVDKRWLLADTASDTASEAVIQTNVVEQLLLDLRDMQIKRVVSHTAENFADFSVTEHDSTVLLSNAKGEPLLHLIVGKPAMGLLSTYVRFAGENRVLTVDKILTWQVKRTADGWLSKEEETE